ncbi:RDD family protein [Streptomyces sp. NPDC021080]|uniref:RDD family protein n=1 Tax=Streptomyces sp. NPDC021080 TaxID=3365110 RepID=UPI00378B094C
MSAPTPAPGDDTPREGYYPDPSIPGYVRYWNGAAWVPGTSRPAPSAGEALAPPAGVRPAQQVPAPASSPESPASRGRTGIPTAEETGPHFFDEDPQPPRPEPTPAPAESQHGSRPEPAASWGADRSRQSGFGGDQDRRVSWGAPQGSGPRDPRAAGPADPVSRPDGASARTDGTTTIPPADFGTTVRPPASAGSVVFRRPSGPVPSTGPEGPEGTGGTSLTSDGSSGGADAWGGPGAGASAGAGPSGAGHPAVTAGGSDPVPGGGDTAFRAPSPRTERQGGGTGPASAPGVSAASGPTAAPGPSAASAARGGTGSAAPSPAPPLRPAVPFTESTASPGGGPGAGPDGFEAGPAAQSPAPGAAQSPVPGVAQSPAQDSFPGAAARASAPAPTVPQQPGGSAPVASGAGGGQPSWAQQVHQLAGDPAEDGTRIPPWKPPVDDPFQAAARRQAAARPSGLGRRLAARLVDTLVIGGVTAAAAVPLGTRAVDHINEKIDTAELSGEKVTVWLLDGTTASCLGAVLAVLLVFGVLYEVLPTAKWGRTAGKKLCGIEVHDIEGHEPPAFGRALLRWLVLTVPCLLLVGFVGVLWCLFDRPWNQCWHDKAAHTFVAGPAR